MDTKKDEILDLFYNKHLKQKDIAYIIGVTTQYISKIIKQDKRYKFEKETRKSENAEKRKAYLKNYFQTYNRPHKENDGSYEKMKAVHERDVSKLSDTNHTISDYAFAKWNSSAYHTNSKGNLVLDKNLTVGFDVPKSINMNIKVPSQKQKYYCPV